jgi:hypothetical protein
MFSFNLSGERISEPYKDNRDREKGSGFTFETITTKV